MATLRAQYASQGRAAFDRMLARLHVPPQYFRYAGLVAITLACALAGAAVGLAVSLLRPDTYEAEASVQVEPQSDTIVSTADDKASSQPAEAERQLNTLIGILRSRKLAVGVARDLELFGNVEFYRAMGSSVPETGAIDNAENVNLTVDLLNEGLVTKIPDESRLITVGFKSRDPEFSASIANRYVKRLISTDLNRRFNSSDYASTYLDKQIALTMSQLEESQRALNNYARAAGIVPTDDAMERGAPPSIIQSSLQQINQSLSAARTKRIVAEQRYRASQNGPLLGVPEVMQNPTIQQLLSERAIQQATLSELSERYTDENLKTTQASARVEQLDRQIRMIGQSVRENIASDYRAARGEERALEGQLNSLKNAGLAEKDRRVRYDTLEQEVEKNKDLYNLLLQRQREVSAEAGVVPNNLSIVDVAAPPTDPSGEGRLFAMLLGFLIGGGLGLVGVFVRDSIVEYPDPTAGGRRDRDRPESSYNLGEVPHISALAGAPFRSLREFHRKTGWAYADLGVPLSNWLASKRGRVLLVSSIARGEGRTTSALAAACIFAELGKRVLLVEADERSPGLAGIIQLPMLSVGDAKRRLGFLATPTDLENFDILPAKRLFTQGEPSSQEFQALLTEAKEAYDVVIVDGETLAQIYRNPLLSCNADRILWVESEQDHRLHTNEQVKAGFRAIGIPALGKLVTFTKGSEASCRARGAQLVAVAGA